MPKKIIVLFILIVMLCTACQNSEPQKDGTETSVNLKEETNAVLENVSYENLEILFDEIEYDGQALEVTNIRVVYPNENLTYEETVELYVNDVFPRLFDLEEVDKSLIYDVKTKLGTGENRVWTFEKDYEDILSTLDSYTEVPQLVYEDVENWREITYTGNWVSGVYITKGVLGSFANSMSPFNAYGMIEEEKTYDCRYDDLSDAYLLMDGEKTVAEAKVEMEAYLDTHYPITGEKNGILNEVYQISVGKISGTEYYAFKAYRTFSYNEIPFREMSSSQDIDINKEFGIMAECALCESDKVDVTIGLINTYSKPEVERVISDTIPFKEVMERVAYYLTGETKFQLLHGGVEYRMFVTADMEYQLVPYWCFIAKNPNDDSMIKIYVDMETGETEHFTY